MIDEGRPTDDDPGQTIPGPTRVVIIGAGFSGIGTAIRLRCAGIEDVVVLERAPEPGGEWRDSVHPDASCGRPSVLRSFWFTRDPAWSHRYTPGVDVRAYMRGVITRHGLDGRIRYGYNVNGLDFDEARGTWHVRVSTSSGEEESITARSVVVATVPFSNASRREIVGADDFRGHKIDGTRWDAGMDVTGLTVAVVGTGTNAVQMIPELVDRARHVTVFQSAPRWVLPHPQYGTAGWRRSLFEKLPLAEDLARSAHFWAYESIGYGLVRTTGLTTALEQVSKIQLRLQVKDRWARRQLAPDNRACRPRLLISNDFLPALDRDNCRLLTFPIIRLTEHGILTVDGVERRFDTIVFDAPGEAGVPFPVRGCGARLLQEEWVEGVYAYKSIHLSGYPNLHFTFGPNSGPYFCTALAYLEAQIDYIVESVRTLERWGLRYIDVRKSAQDRFNAVVQRHLARTTWNSGCVTWPVGEDGFNPAAFPGLARQFRSQMTQFALSDYHAVP
ncbi:flavin-containing monooxygenase [Nocardia asteroides]|uniref:Flavin-containing monooxygenase n=1 Tax=Nocardia asteroides NBRC 15531 TaxID=1110697 RepID=U5E921_NOCAS|nr:MULTISPECIES: NAD(P)/FAD-dependent oxidoreductase [Nocardia]UGT50816.1 NAD(P)/FAD-dependent oxidoreductase [Nocardia asteroides]GAD82983.1 putative flavin-containing monooxygenase [Nocardia asteroides NBRC 15531]SFN86765.1 Predicted flavoprotein CzcO associated with the cation diffusion facilitator CzcD [Nocardia asteroides]VEG36342.1 4-hydroxyacetophenone monooxygenase [Nocardia asteroides]